MDTTKKQPRKLGTPAEETTTIAGVEFKKRVGEFRNVPPKRPYVFSQRLVENIKVGIDLAMNIIFTGPTGTGKTSIVTAIAHEINQPVIRFNCDGETRVSNLRGMMKPTSKDGVLSLMFSRGDLAIAMQEGYWVLFDEIDAALPSVLFVLQSVLEEDKRELHIPETGETIRASEHFRIFGTGNTIGFRAQHRAKHAGTNPMNQAFVDRFGMVIAVSYPSKDEETKRISVHVPSLDPVYLEGIARTGALLRADEKFKADLSTRRLIQWAKLVEAFDGNVLRAADLAFLRKLDTPADAKVARETIGRIFGYSEKEMSEEGV